MANDPQEIMRVYFKEGEELAYKSILVTPFTSAEEVCVQVLDKMRIESFAWHFQLVEKSKGQERVIESHERPYEIRQKWIVKDGMNPRTVDDTLHRLFFVFKNEPVRTYSHSVVNKGSRISRDPTTLANNSAPTKPSPLHAQHPPKPSSAPSPPQSQQQHQHQHHNHLQQPPQTQQQQQQQPQPQQKQKQQQFLLPSLPLPSSESSATTEVKISNLTISQKLKRFMDVEVESGHSPLHTEGYHQLLEALAATLDNQEILVSSLPKPEDPTARVVPPGEE